MTNKQIVFLLNMIDLQGDCFEVGKKIKSSLIICNECPIRSECSHRVLQGNNYKHVKLAKEKLRELL